MRFTMKMSDGEYVSIKADNIDTEGELVLAFKAGEIVAAVHASELVYIVEDGDHEFGTGQKIA